MSHRPIKLYRINDKILFYYTNNIANHLSICSKAVKKLQNQNYHKNTFLAEKLISLERCLTNQENCTELLVRYYFI